MYMEGVYVCVCMGGVCVAFLPVTTCSTHAKGTSCSPRRRWTYLKFFEVQGKNRKYLIAMAVKGLGPGLIYAEDTHSHTYTHTHTHTNTYTHTCIHAHIHTCTHTCIHANIHTHTCIHAHIHTHTHLHTCT